MQQRKYLLWTRNLMLAALIAFMFAFPMNTEAADQGSLLSIKEEAQILPLPDGSGKYLLKSDGFYCLNENGSRDTAPTVHYFDHFVIDGTVFNGYYYHDGSGKFSGGSPHVVYISQAPVPGAGGQGEAGYDLVFDGYYMVNNLGKLTAAPQIRYIDNLVMNGVTFNGYYYFNENGRMVTETGIHEVEMNSNGQHFQGNYYFGGNNGVLVQESGITPDGFVMDETGRVPDSEDLGMGTLKPQLETMMSEYQGEWSVYVKELDTDEEIVLNNKALYSASLIKVFALAETYENLEKVRENEAAKINSTPDSAATAERIDDLLWNMITVSDNESFNELVRLQSEKSDFGEGAGSVNEYLKQEGYADTTVQHTLSPSSTAATGLGGRNTTSVRDCGLLLERIYRGECVSEEASGEMLDLLLNQQVIWKIPQALEDGIVVANKTGETDYDQHDIAIVYGKKTDYILCVMSENCPSEDTAINNIRDISRLVYNYLNL